MTYEELHELKEHVKAEHASTDGIHKYDKKGINKLDAISWAIYHKQKREQRNGKNN